MKIDAHQHFWRIDRYASDWMTGGYAPLRRDRLPEHLAPLLESRGVTGTVFVQAQHDVADNAWLLDELCPRHPWILGAVLWLDTTRPDFAEQLAELRRRPRFCGLRHLVHDEPDDDWVLRPDVTAALRELERHHVPFDLLFRVRHLHHARTLAERFPDLPLILDHLGKPHIAARRLDDWLPALRAAAECPNVSCKLSGMVTEADWARWRPADLEPYVRHALDAFGPERCMFGSDWPVCEAVTSYAEVHDALETVLEELSADERAAVFGTTARRVYGLR